MLFGNRTCLSSLVLLWSCHGACSPSHSFTVARALPDEASVPSSFLQLLPAPLHSPSAVPLGPTALVELLDHLSKWSVSFLALQTLKVLCSPVWSGPEPPGIKRRPFCFVLNFDGEKKNQKQKMTSLLPVVGVLSTELPVMAPHHLSLPGLLPQSLCSLSPAKLQGSIGVSQTTLVVS